MIISNARGHKIYYDCENKIWKYLDDNTLFDDSRACAKCKCYPTREGFDACLGYVENAVFACCGHGIEEGYIKYR